MLSADLKAELSWFTGGSVIAATCCLIIGIPVAATMLFMVCYVIWILFRVNAIVNWLQSGARLADAPQSTSLTNEMVDLIHREKNYSRKQRNRYRGMLTQFNSLASELPDATVVLNEDFVIRWASTASLALLKIHPEKDLGQRIDNLVRNPEFHDFLRTTSSPSETEISAPVDARRTLSIRKVITNDHMTLLIASDITQRVQVRDMRKAFVADVSHELRTPLTVIRGYLEMLQEDNNVDASSREALMQVIAQSDRMRGIVEDLLELSKLEANPLAENEGDTVDVGAMVRAILPPLQKTSPGHQFSFNIDNSLALLGSERELYSVFRNLLENAVNYTQSGSNIKVTWHLQDGAVAVFEVQDDGPGIEARHIDRLSERFYRVDQGRSRALGGTGLGLAIVKHAAQRHGGSLDIDSSPGIGSTFRVRFPAIRVLTLERVANQ
ncbi:MAG: phosphate regulon sensor histidine kinase PhoR [Granulosicoccus sp.]